MGKVLDLVERGKKKPESEWETTTASDVITRCNEASSKMSNTNPHKVVLLEAAYCIRQLVDRLDKYDNGKGVIDLDSTTAPASAGVPDAKR